MTGEKVDVVSHEAASGETQAALRSTAATQAPAEMPGEIARLEDELALLEAAAPLSARETAHYLDVERKLIALQAAAIRAQANNEPGA